MAPKKSPFWINIFEFSFYMIIELRFAMSAGFYLYFIGILWYPLLTVALDAKIM